MATTSGSSASHQVPKRLRPNLPLIACGKCEEKIVMEYRVRKECPNKGHIFYKCPNCNVSYFITFDDYG
jgi:DNA-directed RNA polymerase subunit M/transcription elongation factor TFIIS